MQKDITLHMMIRDEPFSPYAICSIAPYVQKGFIYDTGSPPDLIEDLEECCCMFPHIELVHREIPNAHAWIQKDLEKTVVKDAAKPLGDIRREMLSRTETEFSFTVDGDEVFTDFLAMNVASLIDLNLNGKDALFLKFLDFCHDFKHIRHEHYMGRVFRTKSTTMIGDYPEEMNYHKPTDTCFVPNHPAAMCMFPTTDNMYVQHYESLVKPHRKNLTVIRKFEGQLPEVFERYPQFRSRIERWF